MNDFNFVSARLATGAGLRDVTDVADLAASGITHIIDCRDDFDDAELIKAWTQANPHRQLHYLWNGVPDDLEPKPPEWFDRSIAFALQALTHQRAKVYAHCAQGLNRGPSTAFAVLLALGLSAGRAEQMIKSARPQARLAYRDDAARAVERWL